MRGTEWPTTRSGGAPTGSASRLVSGARARGGADRLDDLAVARAAAEAAAEVVQDVVTRRRRVLLEQRPGREQHPGRAEAALHGAAVEERLLDRVEPSVLGQALDRRHGATIGLDGE